MLVAPSMELDEESIVLDLCSAPGGKLHIFQKL